MNDLESLALHIDFLTLFFGLCVFVSRYTDEENIEFGKQKTHEFFSMLAVVAVLAMNAFFFFKVAQILNKSFYNVKVKLHQICTNLPCCCPRKKYFERYTNEKKKQKSRKNSSVELLLSSSLVKESEETHEAEGGYLEL